MTKIHLKGLLALRNNLVPVLLCILFLQIDINAKGQSLFSKSGTFEVGLGFGPCFFLGDLGGNEGKGAKFVKDINLELTRLDKRAYLVWYPTEWLGFRLGTNYTQVSGDDSKTKTNGGIEHHRLLRNLSFSSTITELYTTAEFYPIAFIERKNAKCRKFMPYLTAGIGLFHFNPKARTDNGTWVELRPLSLEGQGFKEYPERKPYSLTQAEIPVGGGFKYFFNPNFFAGIDLLYRATFTDYVDDVSTSYINPATFSNYLTPTNAAIARQLYYRGSYSNTNATSLQNGYLRAMPETMTIFFHLYSGLGGG